MHFYPPLGFPADRLSHWSRVTPVESVSVICAFSLVVWYGHVPRSCYGNHYGSASDPVSSLDQTLLSAATWGQTTGSLTYVARGRKRRSGGMHLSSVWTWSSYLQNMLEFILQKFFQFCLVQRVTLLILGGILVENFGDGDDAF